MIHSSIENSQPGLQHDSEQTADVISVSPSIANAVLPAVLRLTLKKKWFDMIASGEKKEEYRELKFYWADRLMTGFPSTYGYIEKLNPDFREFQYVEFRNGYSKSAPKIIVECKGFRIGKARPEWSEGFEDDCFIISLGHIVSLTA